MNEPVVKPSILLEQRTPSNIREDYPKFVEFIRNYWEYMEEQGNPVELLINSEKYDDIDRTLDSYIPYYKKQLAGNFPDYAVVNKRLLIKHILDFYRSKGSEEGFSLYFRMVYDAGITIDYPIEKVLYTDDGKWTSKIIIQVSQLVGDPFSFNGQFINFVDDAGTILQTGFVENVSFFTVLNIPIFELMLNPVYVDFTYNDITGATKINTEINGSVVESELNAMLVDATIINAGTGYEIGDQSVIYGGGGGGAVIVVDSVDITTGAITSWHIESFGAGYNESGLYLLYQYFNNLVDTVGGTTYDLVVSSDIVITFPGGDGNAVFGAILGKLASYDKYFSGEQGLISSSMKIQDNHYYQKFSYVINNERSKDIWEPDLKKNIHIAGTKVFSSITNSTSTNIDDLPLNTI